MKQELLYKEQGFETLQQWVLKYWNWLRIIQSPLTNTKKIEVQIT